MSFCGGGKTAEEGTSSGLLWGIENNTTPEAIKIKLNQKIFLTWFPCKPRIRPSYFSLSPVNNSKSQHKVSEYTLRLPLN
jgi:hypothetical protein